MRKRLLTSILAAVSVAVLLLGVPLAVAVSSLLQADALDRLQRDAQTTVTILNREANNALEAWTLLDFVAEQTQIDYTVLDEIGRVLADTGATPTGATIDTADVRHAIASGSPGRLVANESLAVTVPAVVGGSQLLVRATEPSQGLTADVRRAWLAIGALGVTALGAGALLASYLGQRIAAPLESLAEAARRLGEGDFSVEAPRSGLPEADDVAAALDMTAMRLGAVLERSRSFSKDASHQLRTPLTALRLDIEALEATGADPELIAAAMKEADRLEATIDELLTLADPGEDAQLIDLGTLAAGRIDAWRSLARTQGREVVLDAGPVAAVRARPAALGQCLQVLLDNALEHGAGVITVQVRHIPGPGVRLCVSDEGPGFDPKSVPKTADREGVRRGRGLPLARSLVESEGGRLSVERAASGALVCLLMPAESTTAAHADTAGLGLDGPANQVADEEPSGPSLHSR